VVKLTQVHRPPPNRECYAAAISRQVGLWPSEMLDAHNRAYHRLCSVQTPSYKKVQGFGPFDHRLLRLVALLEYKNLPERYSGQRFPVSSNDGDAS
jgi:hypothetical protein